MKTLVLTALILSGTYSFASSLESCETPDGRRRIAMEYVANGGEVPACNHACAEAYVITQVCSGNQVRPSCFTQAGRKLKVAQYKGPAPACGSACAEIYILSQICPK